MGMLLAVFFVGEPIHFLIEFPEHFRCSNVKNILENTRTIRGSWFSYWFTNGNNFHVEHHLYPKASIDQLPEIHKTVSTALKVASPSYFAFYRNAFNKVSGVGHGT
jgi:fatty acid desaturase